MATNRTVRALLLDRESPAGKIRETVRQMIFGDDPHAEQKRLWPPIVVGDNPRPIFTSDLVKTAEGKLAEAKSKAKELSAEFNSLNTDVDSPRIGEAWDSFQKRIGDVRARLVWLESEALPAAQAAIAQAEAELKIVKSAEAEVRGERLIYEIAETDRQALASLLSALDARKKGYRLRDLQRQYISVANSGGGDSGKGAWDELRILENFPLGEAWAMRGDSGYKMLMARIEKRLSPLLAEARALLENDKQSDAD